MERKTEENNKKLVLEPFDTLFNKHDYAAAERYWSPHYIQHNAHIEPGFNHMAFTAEDRSDVDKMYELLKQIGATVLDAPAEYPYSPGYFAVYFTDPDGLKFEFAHAPRP